MKRKGQSFANGSSNGGEKRKKANRPNLLAIPPLKRTATNLEILETVMALDEDQTMYFNYNVERNFPEALISSTKGSNSVQLDFAKLLESPKIPGNVLANASAVTNYFVENGKKAAKQDATLKSNKPSLSGARNALNSLVGGGIQIDNNNNYLQTCTPSLINSKTYSADIFDNNPDADFGGGDLKMGEEKRVTVYWYCGNCSKNQVKTPIDIDDVNVPRCPKCNHLKPVKKIIDATQEETESAALVIENIINTLNPSPVNRVPSLHQIPSLSRGPSLTRANSRTNPAIPALSRSLSGANAFFDMDLFRQDSWTDNWDVSFSSSSIAPPNINFRGRSTGFGSGITPPTGVARQHSLSLIRDDLLSNYVEQNVDDRSKSKVKLCWFCPNVNCEKEIDLWDNNLKCSHCDYLKPTKIPILTLNKPFKCDICGKMFSRSHTLREHQHIHTNNRPYGCKWEFRGCKQRFNDSSNKRAHEKMSCKYMLGKPEKKFYCDLCPYKDTVDPETGRTERVYLKQYARRIDLLDHKTSKHGGNPKPYSCEECGKKYANKANVSRHKKKAHGKVAPYNNVKGKKNKGKSKATKKKVVGKKKS
eukprot:g8922.t1